jgi:DNA-binding IclR family transcriptional regulator
VAAISISTPATRMTEQREKQIQQALYDSARRIAALLDEANQARHPG